MERSEAPLMSDCLPLLLSVVFKTALLSKLGLTSWMEVWATHLQHLFHRHSLSWATRFLLASPIGGNVARAGTWGRHLCGIELGEPQPLCQASRMPPGSQKFVEVVW